MASVNKIVRAMRTTQGDMGFVDLLRVCVHYFGEPRVSGSHCVFKTPWPEDPRINIQDKGGKAKPYQVKQVLAAIDKLKERKRAEG